MLPNSYAQVCYRSRMRSLALVLPFALLACASDEASVTAVTIGDATYRIPAGQINSLSRDPHQFVRITAPDRTFDLIYDSRTAAQADRAGRPIVFSVNDDRKPGVEHYRHGNLMVVCRRAVDPDGGCGLKVFHRGAEWTVLFPNAHLSAADAIRRRALGVLDSYS